MKNDRRAFRRGVYWTLAALAAVSLSGLVFVEMRDASCVNNERIVDAMVTCMKAPTLTCTYTPAQLIEAERARLDFIESCRE